MGIDLTKDMISCILDTDPDKRYTIEDIRKHSWFNQISTKTTEGILVGYTQIPINKEILQKLSDFNINIEHGQKCIEANKHNHITTTYYLLMKKYLANEGVIQLPSEKTIFPHPPLLPFAPLLSLNIKPSLRHRKYIEKNFESTEGSFLHGKEIGKKNTSPTRVISTKSNSHIKENIPNIKNIRSRRYVSTTKGTIKEPQRTGSRPTRLRTQKIKSVRACSSKKINQSFDYRQNTLNSSYKASPKFQEMSFFLNKLKL
ncbi:hypothetical protein SteCoe_10887 [Stentor coeruleus]|uniref:Protein kinase domain-containing protein n=1 Tax=Stentor coeruleus TaxID=5963 RepID=A0A1R2CEF0_9CILI|nr:hypothetical protein SteCoe_10887 [Stentor coeruleus]